MTSRPSRRKFLRSGAAASAAVLGLGDLPFLGRLPPVSADEVAVDAKAVRFHPSIEPLVRLLEETPRDRLLEEVAGRVRRGLSYRDVLAALLLAGIRNVQPRPSVGYKFHAVLVVHSAHLASLSSPPEDRWLPIFWALDYFKSSQARDVSQGDWTMSAVEEGRVPGATKAPAAFTRAMDRWDEAGADAAAAGLARSHGAGEVFEILFRYGMRDFRSIGHKAIYVANSFRALHTIGWHHAEPVVRSLAYAMLNHEGGNPAERDAPADRPWRRNLELADEIPDDWRGGKPDEGATQGLLGTLRDGSDEDAAREVVELLGKGVSPASIWDGLFAGAMELVLRQSSIVPLHAVTTSNAIHQAYLCASSDRTRRLALLQLASFLPFFRDAAKGRGGLRDVRIDGLEPAAASEDDGEEAVGRIFATASDDRSAAVAEALGWLGREGRPGELIEAARVLVFLKGDDAHDYKYSSAVLEDYWSLSPGWRDRYLAGSVALLRASGEPDNSLVGRTREALGGKSSGTG